MNANIETDFRNLLNEFFEKAPCKSGEIFVLGCSTSEVIGEHIGKNPCQETAENIIAVAVEEIRRRGLHLAVQCCEHLNRALVVEKETAEFYALEQVSVVPVYNAGGSAASAAYKRFNAPVVAESIKAHAGMDIGSTLIGMHLRHVAVPVRLSARTLGAAYVTAAVTRPKYIGGSRAVYE